ncbi:LPS-assembly protein LptD [Candidatus Pelagadaptatus aseana]|uniref:LPS-assembly protein LptD n=1 Tax=Candidatus Pelagadaptatus aseana TaxID=3120508 RepID=UPI003C6EC481
MDWVDEADLNEEQKLAQKPGCCGAYVQPEQTHEDAELKPEDAPLRASADRSEVQQESVAKLEGDVRLTQGYRILEADEATLDQAANTANLKGNIRIREPGLLLTGSSADVDMNSNDAVINNASYLLHDAGLRGDAGELQHLSDNRMVMQNASLTQCEPDSNLWHFESSELEIDPNTLQGKGKHVRLKIKDVPVFYTPYIQFPIGSQRMTGFLFPSFSQGEDNGLDISTPFYLNLAPNYDATITPRYIGERGEMLELEGRHMSANSETDLSLAHLYDDKGGDDSDLLKLVEAGDPDAIDRYHKGDDRWLADFNHRANYSSGVYTIVDYTRVSDKDFFQDLDTTSLEVNSATHLKETGTVGYRTQNWHSKIKVEQYQTISRTAESPYQQMPRINIDGNYDLGWDLKAELNHEYTEFDHRDADSEAWATGQRGYVDYGLTWDKSWIWGFFKPGISVKHLSYELDDKHLIAGASDSPSFTVPQGSLDMGLYFERDGSMFGHGYLQTFEPRLYYFYSDYENQDELIGIETDGDSIDFDSSELTFSYSQLFRDRRFAGHDRIGDDNRLSVGLTTRFIEMASGIERFRASLGQIYYYDDRAVDLTLTSEEARANALNTANDSEIALELAGRIYDHWQLSTSLMLDDDNNDKASRGNFSLRYRDDDYRLINLSYRYVRKDPVADVNDVDNDLDVTELIDRDVEQADLSFAWPLTDDWNIVGRYNHDITNSRELETLAGLEYNDCCYRVRIVARKWLDTDLQSIVDDTLLEDDQGIFFEFQLKGLGSIGSKLEGILSDGIYGYDLREQNLK